MDARREGWEVTDALGAQRRLLEFCYFGTRYFLAQSLGVSNALNIRKPHPNRKNKALKHYLSPQRTKSLSQHGQEHPTVDGAPVLRTHLDSHTAHQVDEEKCA